MKPIRLFLLPAILALALAGCGNIKTAINVVSGVTITQDQLDALVAAYDVAVLTPYNTYRYSNAAFTVPRRYCTTSAPFTISSPCAKYSVLAKMQPVLRAVDVEEKRLQAAVTGCNVNNDQTACSGIQGAKAAFNAAVSVAKSTATALGVI